MADESDGIEEAFDGQLRVLVTAAGQVGESIARAREESARRAQAQSQQEARELTSRFEAERTAAHAELGSVYRSEWWDRATPEQIGNTYQTARTWAGEDAEASRAEGRMRDELRTRYGVDVNNTNADPAAVRDAVERAEQARGQSDPERQRAAAEQAEAARLVVEADTADRAAERARETAEGEPDPELRADAREQAASHQSQANGARADSRPLYDSAERREVTARDLESKGVNSDAVAAKMRADVSQAKPATDAAKGDIRTSPNARKTRGRAPQVQRAEPGR